MAALLIRRLKVGRRTAFVFGTPQVVADRPELEHDHGPKIAIPVRCLGGEERVARVQFELDLVPSMYLSDMKSRSGRPSA